VTVIFTVVLWSTFTALQVDLNRHTFEGVRITDNAGNGLEVLYSDLHNSLSYIRNSEFSGNKGAGIFFKQLGLVIQGKYCTYLI